MPMLNSTLREENRSRQVDQDRREALKRLQAHYVAVDNLIRAFEKYQRFGPARESQSCDVWEKCS